MAQTVPALGNVDVVGRRVIGISWVSMERTSFFSEEMLLQHSLNLFFSSLSGSHNGIRAGTYRLSIKIFGRKQLLHNFFQSGVCQ